MGLYKVQSGFVFQDNFDKTSLNGFWTVSPFDIQRFSLTERPGFMRLKHGSKPIYMLTDISQYENLVFEIRNNYFPIAEGEAGGIYVAKDSDQYIELYEEYKVNTTDSQYQYLRVHKNKDFISAYFSENGINWAHIGDKIFNDARYIGIGLMGITGSHYEVDYVKTYIRPYVEIIELNEGQKVEFYNEYDYLLDTQFVPVSETSVKVSHGCYPVRGYFKIYNTNNSLQMVSDIITEIYGGDKYAIGDTLDIYKDDILIQQMSDFDLGRTDANGVIEHKLTLKNGNDSIKRNITISVIQYEEQFGYEWVDVANHDVENNQPLEYVDMIQIPDLSQNQSEEFWVRITRSNTIQSGTNKCKFYLSVNFD